MPLEPNIPDQQPEDLDPPRDSMIVCRQPESGLVNQSREGLNLDKIFHSVSLPFRPRLTKTLLPYVIPFIQLQPEIISYLVRGLILDVDGTLAPHHSNDFDPRVLQKIEEMRDHGLQICVFSNNNQPRPALEKLRLPFIMNVKPKPHPHGFEVAANNVLGLPPKECAAIGDNPLTDGGALRAGMNFILVQPLRGTEPLGHKITRSYGHVVKFVHDSIRRSLANY